MLFFSLACLPIVTFGSFIILKKKIIYIYIYILYSLQQPGKENATLEENLAFSRTSGL